MVAIDSGARTLLTQRLEAALEQAHSNLERLEVATSTLRQTWQITTEGRWRSDVLHRSAYARLEAKLATLPTIEQAKGILMARNGCGPDEAFNLLRAASQRANIKVRDLAAEIVAKAVGGSAN